MQKFFIILSRKILDVIVHLYESLKMDLLRGRHNLGQACLTDSVTQLPSNWHKKT